MEQHRALTVLTHRAVLEPSAPPPFPCLPQEVHLWYAPLAMLRARLDAYGPLLDNEEKARADRFLHARDRERFIAGHGLSRMLLGGYLGIAPGAIQFRRGEFGKPFLEGHPLHFNLSDTKDAVLLAVAPWPIGADIETMHRNTDHQQVADHYFSAMEVASIRDAPDGLRRFLELWTRKEAVLKASGVGLMDDLKKLEVGGPANTMTISHPDFIRLAAPTYHVYTLYPGKDHPVSVASPLPINAFSLFQGDGGQS